MRVGDLRPGPAAVVPARVHVHPSARQSPEGRADEQIQGGVQSRVLLAVHQLPRVLGACASIARQRRERAAAAARVPRGAGGARCGEAPPFGEVRSTPPASDSRPERSLGFNRSLRASRAAASGASRLLRAEQGAGVQQDATPRLFARAEGGEAGAQVARGAGGHRGGCPAAPRRAPEPVGVLPRLP